jgi:hypothetical protein
MELFLNLVWLLLAVATVLFWSSLCPIRRNHRSLSHGLIVLGCVMTLLFPVISMTDDLLAQQVAMEDASATTKRLVKSGERVKVLLNQRHVPAVLLFSLPGRGQWRVLGQVAPAVDPLAAMIPPPHSSGRAPPSL